MNIYITGSLLTLILNIIILNSQCKEGTSDLHASFEASITIILFEIANSFMLFVGWIFNTQKFYIKNSILESSSVNTESVTV